MTVWMYDYSVWLFYIIESIHLRPTNVDIESNLFSERKPNALFQQTCKKHNNRGSQTSKQLQAMTHF